MPTIYKPASRNQLNLLTSSRLLWLSFFMKNLTKLRRHISGSQPRVNSPQGSESRRFRGEANETFKKFNPNYRGNIFKKDFAEKTGPEKVHASGAGHHTFKESSLIWPILFSKEIAIGGESSAIQTIGGEQAGAKRLRTTAPIHRNRSPLISSHLSSFRDFFHGRLNIGLRAHDREMDLWLRMRA